MDFKDHIVQLHEVQKPATEGYDKAHAVEIEATKVADEAAKF